MGPSAETELTPGSQGNPPENRSARTHSLQRPKGTGGTSAGSNPFKKGRVFLCLAPSTLEETGWTKPHMENLFIKCPVLIQQVLEGLGSLFWKQMEDRVSTPGVRERQSDTRPSATHTLAKNQDSATPCREAPIPQGDAEPAEGTPCAAGAQ